MALYALVPAAGRGERFGSHKLLARWRDRELLAHVLATLAGARAAGLLSRSFVVHRPDDLQVARLATEYLAWPVPIDSEGSLSDSLGAGIRHLQSIASAWEPTALLVCLGDQPLLRLDVIQELIRLWKEGAAAARPSYREDPGTPGHPMLIDRSLWKYATEMKGDLGFGPVLAQRGISVQQVRVAGHNPDVDTANDLAGLEASGPFTG